MQQHKSALELIPEAIRRVRSQLGETQEEFGRRLGTTGRSVARYEAGDVPNSKVVAALEQICLEQDFVEAVYFRDLLFDRLGVTYFGDTSEVTFRTHDERMLAGALLYLKRIADPGSKPEEGPYRYDPEWKNVKNALREPLQELQAAYAHIDRCLGAIRSVASGKSYAAVETASGMSKDNLRLIYEAFQQVWPELPGESEKEKYNRCRALLVLNAQGVPAWEVGQRFLRFQNDLASRLENLWVTFRSTQ